MARRWRPYPLTQQLSLRKFSGPSAFRSDAIGNPMFALSEWASAYVTKINTTKTMIPLLKLCKLTNTCLLIPLYAVKHIPAVLTNFFALRHISFVGLDNSKDLQLLSEDLESRSGTQSILARLLQINGKSSLRIPRIITHVILTKCGEIIH